MPPRRQYRFRVTIWAGLISGVTHAQTRDLRADLNQLEVRHRTTHYELAGTISEARLEDYGRALEFAHHEYTSGFEDLIRPASSTKARPSKPTAGGTGNPPRSDKTRKRLGRPAIGDNSPSQGACGDDDRFRVIVLETEAQYSELTSAYFGGVAEHTRGLYVPAVRLLIIADAPGSSETYQILFHEAFHQFLHRYVPAAPIWVNEGLATHFGTAVPTPDGFAFSGRDAGLMGVVRDAVDARAVIPFRDLLIADPRIFYDRSAVPRLSFDRRTLAYAQAYSLVAFMLEDAEGRQHLRAYLKDLCGAQTPAETQRITAEQFPDALLDDLIEPWVRFINR